MIPPKYAFYSTLGALIAHTTSVYTYSPRSNDPLTPEQADMLRESISDHQTISEAMIPVIEKHEKEISAQETAISRLEATISVAELALNTQQHTLSILEELQENLEPAEDGLDWTTPSEVNKRCETTVANIDTQLRLSAAGLVDSISRLKEYLPRLSTSIQEMKSEVSSRRFMRDALSKCITDTRKYQDETESNIRVFRSLLNNVNNIPAEVWAKIFLLRVHVDMAEFFTSPEQKPMPSTVVRLSQVCRLWRGAVRSQRSLWHFVPIYDGDLWSHPRTQLLHVSTEITSKTSSFVWNLSRQTYSRFGFRGGAIEADAVSIANAYSLRIIAPGHGNQSPTVPFRQPKLLTLQFLSSPSGGFLNSLLHGSDYTELEIIINGYYEPSGFILSQQVAYLKLDMKDFTLLDVTRCLGQNLQELHIINRGTGSIISMDTNLRLPKLKVLGVTLADTSFTHSLDLPALKRIILYGPGTSLLPTDSLALFADTSNFNRVRTLEIRDLSLYPSGQEIQWSTMTYISHIVDKMRSVMSLKCVDSYINGPELVKFCRALKSTSNDTSSKLEHVLIDCCAGLTRDECDAVGQLVEQLEVYV